MGIIAGPNWQARESANEAARQKLGGRMWRSLPPDLELQYRSLMGPLTDDPSALIGPLLIIAKVFVDGLDSKLLKQTVGGAEKDERSLSLLKKLLISLGDTRDASKVLRDLYAMRPRGDVAHLSNSKSRVALDVGARGVRRTAVALHAAMHPDQRLNDVRRQPTDP